MKDHLHICIQMNMKMLMVKEINDYITSDGNNGFGVKHLELCDVDGADA